MAVFLSPVGGAGAQFFDNNGDPLSGGKLYTYVAGTTTPQATYTSSAGTTLHSNPIVLDSAGRVPEGEIWLTDLAVYKFVLKTSADVLLATWDNIIGSNDVDASEVTYDDSTSGLASDNVQEAIDELMSIYVAIATNVQAALDALEEGKQDELVSGTNIKTVAGLSLLGSGDIDALLTSDFTGSNVSLASSGYQKLPSGLILQWGTDGGRSSEGTTTVTFPITFPTSVMQVIAGTGTDNSVAIGPDVVVQVKSYSVTGATFVHNSVSTATGPSYGRYVAIGY